VSVLQFTLFAEECRPDTTHRKELFHGKKITTGICNSIVEGSGTGAVQVNTSTEESPVRLGISKTNSIFS
jgi:hypothetical protein